MDLSEVKHLPKLDHTPAEMAPWQRRLLHAATLLETHGHCKGEARGAGGSYCVIWALADSNGGRFDMENELRILAATGFSHVFRWSDDTPSSEVIAKLRAVALGL